MKIIIANWLPHTLGRSWIYLKLKSSFFLPQQHIIRALKPFWKAPVQFAINFPAVEKRVTNLK